MRAFVKDRFEDQGAVREVADPTPTAGEVRVRVHAASVNPMDAGAASGMYKDFMPDRRAPNEQAALIAEVRSRQSWIAKTRIIMASEE